MASFRYVVGQWASTKQMRANLEAFCHETVTRGILSVTVAGPAGHGRGSWCGGYGQHGNCISGCAGKTNAVRRRRLCGRFCRPKDGRGARAGAGGRLGPARGGAGGARVRGGGRGKRAGDDGANAGTGRLRFEAGDGSRRVGTGGPGAGCPGHAGERLSSRPAGARRIWPGGDGGPVPDVARRICGHCGRDPYAGPGGVAAAGGVSAGESTAADAAAGQGSQLQ